MKFPFKATCCRCHQGINNVCRFEGKAYGTECILHVTNNKELLNHIRSLRRQRSWNLDADEWLKKREEHRMQQKATQKQQKAMQKKREKERQAIAQDNAWLIEVLQAELDCNTIKTIQGVNFYSKNMDFVEAMVEDLKSRKFVEMSERTKEALIDIYARSFGRRNSKAYNQAYDYASDRACFDD